MEANLVIGIDCSTTSCKAIVWNQHGKKVAEGRVKIKTFSPKPLWYEQSADSWWYATVKALQQVQQQINPNQILALCISAQRETFVPVDKSNKPIRNAILWMDERAEKQLHYLEHVFGREKFHKLTGKHLSGNLSIAKIIWLQKNEPEVFSKTSKFLDVHGYLVYQFTDQLCTSWGCADPMGLFDMTQNNWAKDLLNCVDLKLCQFPDAVQPGYVIGNITPKASKECGLPIGLPIVSGIGDGQAAGLGSKIISNDIACISLGTSIVAGYFASDYQSSKNFRTMYGGIENTFFFETVILGGTFTISWFLEKVLHAEKKNIRNYQFDEEYLEKEARKAPIGSQGLLLFPYWNSVMNPFWDPKASGMMIGLRGIHGVGHIYRAMLEGIAFEQKLQSSYVEDELGRNVGSYVVGGGGAKSNLWCQIIADIIGRPVYRTIEQEVSSLGVGILAASATGIYGNVKEASNSMVQYSEDIFSPDEKRNQYYSKLFESVYRDIFPIMQEKLRVLNDLMENHP
ncbi:MAG: FGGY-family carbohydrate kinase [Anaerolineales bacterium]|jgi:xylulokinase